MAKRGASPSRKAYYAAYPTKAQKHRERRLERHLKKYPNDVQAKQALKNGPSYRRKKPFSTVTRTNLVEILEKNKIVATTAVRVSNKIHREQMKSARFLKHVDNFMQRSPKKEAVNNLYGFPIIPVES